MRSRCPVLVVAILSIFLAVGCDTSHPTGTAKRAEGSTLRPPTARERREIVASIDDSWLYESRRPEPLDEYFHGHPRRPRLHPVILKTRVLRADPRYGSAVVALRDEEHKVRNAPWLLVLQRGITYPLDRWGLIAGPATDFPLSCTTATPKPVRTLMCPNPWWALGHPRPLVREQTALVQPVASTDLHRVDWGEVALPGAACGSSQSIRPRRRRHGQRIAFVRGDVNLPWWNPVVVSSSARPVFGDLDGDGRDEAALHVICANGGGTAAGQLRFSDVVFQSAGNTLRVVGIVKPQQPLDPAASHVPLEVVRRIELGKVIAREAWYGRLDGTCCPSGRVETTWSYKHGELRPSQVRVVRPPSK